MKNPNGAAAGGRTSTYQLLVFGTGGLIPIALFNIAGQLMGLMGNISLGLSAFWLGTILVIPRFWDAVSDPVIGYVTDHTRSRWGRRRPFVLVGGITVALTFVMMWWIPEWHTMQAIFPSEAAYKWFQLFYILFSLLLFFTACNLFEIPHGALGMEMSQEPHERTRLFSAKSFFGNLFAMGTPWLFALAGMEIFRGRSGTEMHGMRYVSLIVAAVLIPASVWWFFQLKEPDSPPAASAAKKSSFWADMRHTGRNKNFLLLVAVVFSLAMGFNFVGLLNYYISIFYLFGGDKTAAGPLLGINGTVWAIVGLIAVFPLNWMSPKLGKKNTLIISILLMCLAQISKIFCYDPARPYLVVVPTVLLSAGMLFFFTLGSSMVGDICDEDELNTGKRAEGTYYSVFWWFIKIGTALASFVMGLLIVFSRFDEIQVTRVDALKGQMAEVQALTAPPIPELRGLLLKAESSLAELRKHLEAKEGSHSKLLLDDVARLEAAFEKAGTDEDMPRIREALSSEEVSDALLQLARQSPDSLLRMRVIEIALPILLCVVSLLFALKYPLTDQRCREIQLALAEKNKLR